MRWVDSLRERLDDDAFRWKPPSGKWSIAQHLVHTGMTTKGYLPVIDAAVDEARRRGHLGAGPYRGGLLGRLFVRSLSPPSRLRVKTFAVLEPPPDPSREEAVREFEEAVRELLLTLERAEGVDLGRARMRSPFFPLLRLSVSQGFEAALRHTERHMWHVERLEADSAFPAPR